VSLSSLMLSSSLTGELYNKRVADRVTISVDMASLGMRASGARHLSVNEKGSRREYFNSF
jgi:hypothetical protein